jgi:hypothetical protein
MDVRAVKVEGMEPVRRFEVRARETNPVSPPRVGGMEPTKELVPKLMDCKVVRELREGGMVPESLFVAKDKEETKERPEIPEGREPVKLFEPKLREITLLFAEQVRPVHTGEEHLEATFAQFHSERTELMLVELIRAQRAVFSSAMTK